MSEELLRDLTPQVLGVLVRRGSDFASAEDAVQEALIAAHRVWPEQPPDEPRAWLVTVAQHKLVDLQRSAAARRRREDAVAVVLRVVYLIFNEGYGGRVDLAAEAIRLTRLLARESAEPEVAGMLALMLLHDARRDAPRDDLGAIEPLAEQDRSLWNHEQIAEGVRVLEAALALDRRGEYEIQAAIAALHDDAAAAEETDWPQILAWYDELMAVTDNPMAALSRAVVVGEVDRPDAGLRALSGLDAALGGHHRLAAVRAHLHERAGDLHEAAALYLVAARRTTSTSERDHLTRKAARLRATAAHRTT